MPVDKFLNARRGMPQGIPTAIQRYHSIHVHMILGKFNLGKSLVDTCTRSNVHGQSHFIEKAQRYSSAAGRHGWGGGGACVSMDTSVY